MMYGSLIWSSFAKEDLLRVFKLKKVARVGVDVKTRSAVNFKKLKNTHCAIDQQDLVLSM